MNDNLISIIVPIYNVEKYLNQCIQSIVKQTYKNLEIILIDDGSTDKSPELCDEWATNDKRIKVIHQKNQGAAMAKNQGLESATGELIAFVDSDDCIKIDMYERLYKLLKEKQCDIVECGYQCFENNITDEKITKNRLEICNNEKAIEYLIDNSLMKQVVWNKLYRKEVIGDIRFPKGRYIDDEFWTYKVLNEATRVCITNEKMYYYRQHNSSIMGRQYNVKRLDAVDAFEERMVYIKKNQPKLKNKATLSYIGMVMYQYQCLTLHRKKLDKDKRFRNRIFKGVMKLEKSEFKKAIALANTKYKLWYRMFFVCPDVTCRIRNYLKIGL